MKVRGKGAVLHGPEGATPPQPYITVDDAEGLALISQGVGEEVREELAAGLSPVSVAPEPVPPVVEVAPAPEPVAENVVVQEPAVEPPAATPEPVVAEEPDERRQVIADAIVLLSDDELVKTGARAGKPLVSILKAATGLEDLTAEEVDAVFDTIEGGQ